MDKGEVLERLARLFEEGRVVIPSRIPVELLRWRPESDASLALRFALAMGLSHGAGCLVRGPCQVADPFGWGLHP